MILKPLYQMIAVTRQVAHGDHTSHVIADSEDEIGELGKAFNAMTENLQRVEKLRRQMVIDVAHDGHMVGYREKPSTEIIVSIGVNVVQASSIAAITPGERIDVPAFMQRLMAEKRHVHCHVIDGFWLDLGRVDDYQEANDLVAAEPGRFLPT